jgi:hypothetical protein
LVSFGVILIRNSSYLLGTIDAAVSNITTKVLPDGTIALAFSAPVDATGNLLNTQRLPKPRTTAREYETIRIRYWNKYWDAYRSTLWYTTIYKDSATLKYKLNQSPPVNAFAGTKIEFPWCESPFAGGTYDISQTGLVVSVVDTNFDPAKYSISEVYFVPLTSFAETHPCVVPLSSLFKSNMNGSASGGVFSPDGEKIAFMKQKSRTKQSDHPFIFLFDLKKPDEEPKICIIDWDRAPTSLLWSFDNTLYVLADDLGKNRLFKLKAGSAMSGNFTPKEVKTIGSIDSVYKLPSGNANEPCFLVNTTSLVDPRQFHLIRGEIDKVIFSTTKESLLGLHTSQISQCWYPGAGNYNCHAFVIKPSHYQEGREYPVALWIHGGPQIEWTDSWSYVCDYGHLSDIHNSANSPEEMDPSSHGNNLGI